ncbi:class I SAM-dependent methyltransferase [Pseudanabaena sp. Chao 1811]|uniref:class I SAM-dependent methyltransferase n=1 Tax=Pseudanabaena sp. Chao 1811 TaxID=2963092 RepID=UPI0022F3DB9B|nr:methyltransferase domain-containing protein [Pseudanabaena sp. Chao 1811]
MSIIKNLSSLLSKVNRKTKIRSINKTLSNHKSPYKLHIGCGSIRLDDWINIDKEQSQVVDIIWDTSYGLPFLESNSCSLIYNEHFLEHLSIEQAIFFLKECHRILKSNGVLRIAMPSLEYTVDKYQSENWRDQDWLKWEGHEFIKTRAEMINISFRWWGHQWMYDREELHRRIKEAGFRIIKDVEWGVSEVTELNNLETRKDSKLICEAIKD